MYFRGAPRHQKGQPFPVEERRLQKGRQRMIVVNNMNNDYDIIDSVIAIVTIRI